MMLQKQDFKTLAQLQALGADENSLLDDSYLYVKAANKNALLQTVIQNIFSDIGRYGFINIAETTISFDDTTYTFTLTSVGAGWYYMRNGKINYVTGNKTVVLPGTPPTAGNYFIYIDSDNGTLIQSTTAWTLLDTKVLVAIVKWDNTLTPKYWLADERHQSLVDRRWHYYAHNTSGTKVIAGSTLAGYTVAPAVPTDANNTLSISQASIADEDLLFTLSSVTDPDGATNAYYVFYRTSANTWAWEVAQVPFRYTAAGFIQYDNAGTMTQGANNRWYNYYLLYTNLNGLACFIWVPGRASFTSLALAQAEDPTSFDFTGLGISEFVIAYQLTFNAQTGFNNKGKCRVAATARRINSNVTTPSVVGSNIDHETLLNLLGGAANDHQHLTTAQLNLLLSGGGGGGGGLDWNTDGGAPLVVDNGIKGYQFDPLSELDGPQVNKVFVPIPESFVVGSPAKLFIYIHSASNAGDQFIKCNTYLVRPGVDAMDSTLNLYTSTNAAVANPGTAKIQTKIELDLASSAGVINSVNIQAGWLLRVEMERGSDGDTNPIIVSTTMTLKFS
jgi:hypothetical protein